MKLLNTELINDSMPYINNGWAKCVLKSIERKSCEKIV